MLNASEFIRFISLLVYIGFIVSSITGFVEAGDASSNDHTITIITTGLVVFIQNLVYFVIETMKLYEKSIFINRYIYYIRAILIIESAILCIGISSVGVGFGVFGIFMFLVNMLAGVFFIDHNTRILPQDDNRSVQNLD